MPLILLGARGELARHQGAGALEADFVNRPYYLRAVETYTRIDRDTRDVYEGFAAGVNRYIALHPEEFPPWMRPEFTGHDVAAAYIYRTSQATIRRWMRRLTDAGPAPIAEPEEPDRLEEGSSAWALAPGRTTSGAAILLRNPHLSWNAGYWEAHVVVPGRLDFYGDFRIGGPIGIVGGFNQHLGFATTNNDVNTEEVYALEPGSSARRSLPVRRGVHPDSTRANHGVVRQWRQPGSRHARTADHTRRSGAAPR